MKKLTLAAAVLLASNMISTVYAGSMVNTGPTIKDPAHEADLKKRYDHPLTQTVSTETVKVDINMDTIMRSCCAPPNLVVAGKVTNVGDQAIDFVKLTFSFEDNSGKVLYAESIYNEKAASLQNDAELQALLNEKPHFEVLPPGAGDKFTFSIPMTMLPKYDRVSLLITQTKATPEQLAAMR
jgi:hypothetical protein